MRQPHPIVQCVGPPINGVTEYNPGTIPVEIGGCPGDFDAAALIQWDVDNIINDR